MKKLTGFVAKVLKFLGWVQVEHFLYWEEYAQQAGRDTLTIKNRIVTEIEWFHKNTPKKVIEAYNKAFARQKLSIYNKYTNRAQWTWRLLE